MSGLILRDQRVQFKICKYLSCPGYIKLKATKN